MRLNGKVCVITGTGGSVGTRRGRADSDLESALRSHNLHQDGASNAGSGRLASDAAP
jgi:hypothetical protein